MDISGKTRLLCLLGHPVAHSISPAMHNLSCQKLGLDYAYLAFDVPGEKTGEAIAALKTMHARGCNLTMPLKNTVGEFLDEIKGAAAFTRSVNTVVFEEDGRTTGYSTDGEGYLAALKDSGFEYEKKTVTLLGAGGAATAIAAESALSGVQKINLCKRKNASWEKAQAFTGLLNEKTDCAVSILDITDEKAMKQSIEESDLLVNATNVGMGDDDRTPIDPSWLDGADLFVSDIIYHPAETPLLKEAKRRGLTVSNGAMMLLYQGAASFQLWTGCSMPVSYLKEKLF